MLTGHIKFDLLLLLSTETGDSDMKKMIKYAIYGGGTLLAAYAVAVLAGLP